MNLLPAPIGVILHLRAPHSLADPMATWTMGMEARVKCQAELGVGEKEDESENGVQCNKARTLRTKLEKG